MKLMKTILVALLAVSASMFSGCQSPTGALPPLHTGKYDLENRASFVLLDKGTQRSITCTGIQERRNADGRLEVVANIQNLENRRLQVQVNCEFKDGQGFTVDSTPFQTLILTENSQESVRFTSMNEQPSRYTIRVRQAR